MSGLRRTVFAGLAEALRLVAWAPLGIGLALAWLADCCEELSR